VLVILISLVFALPVQIAFQVGPNYGGYDILVDVTFILDMILTFFTVVETKNGRYVTNHSELAKRYLKFWFWLDIISIFPFHALITGSSAKLTRFLRLPRLIKLVRVLRLRKLFSSPRFQTMLLAIEYSPRIHPSVFRVGKVVVFLVVFAHIMACCWFWVGNSQESGNAWVSRLFDAQDGTVLISELDAGRQYLISVYFVLTVCTTIGFGDISPRTVPDMFMCLFIMLVGATFFSYVVGTLASAVSASDTQENEFRNKMNLLVTYLNDRKDVLSVKTRSKITATMAMAWAKGATVNPEEFLGSRGRCLLHTCAL